MNVLPSPISKDELQKQFEDETINGLVAPLVGLINDLLREKYRPEQEIRIDIEIIAEKNRLNTRKLTPEIRDLIKAHFSDPKTGWDVKVDGTSFVLVFS